MTSLRSHAEDLRRARLWGGVAGGLVAVAGGVAGESLGTILVFSLASAGVVGAFGYFRGPPDEKTDADRMRWWFAIVFRGIGRGGR